MSKVIYWRQELPPLGEVIEGEHEVEAESPHVHYNLYDRSGMWSHCYGELAELTEARIRQEIERLGGSCAHILGEEITGRTDDAAALFWLRGRFRFLLYRHPANDAVTK